MNASTHRASLCSPSERANGAFGGSVAFGWLSKDFGPDGHIGDPLGATAERGQALFAGAVESYAAALHEIDAFELPTR